MSLTEEQKEKIESLASKLANDFDKDEAKDFSQKHKDKKWYDDFVLLYNLITDPDFKIPQSAYWKIAGALAYVIFPVDVLPDFIPMIGWLDDIFLLGLVISSLNDLIEEYKKFKGQDAVS